MTLPPSRVIDVHHLPETAGLRMDQHVGQEQGEGLVADHFAGAPHGVAKAQRLLLAGEARLAGHRQVALERFEIGVLCRAAQRLLQLILLVEMILDDALLRPVTKTKCSMPASRASSTANWMTGRSTMVSISLGMALVAGRNRVPSPATGNTALRMRRMHLPLIKPVAGRGRAWKRIFRQFA